MTTTGASSTSTAILTIARRVAVVVATSCTTPPMRKTAVASSTRSYTRDQRLHDPRHVARVVQLYTCATLFYMSFEKLETTVERNRIYEHYRGNRYIVVDIAKNADLDGDVFCVIYRALYDHGQLYTTSMERFTGMNAEGAPRFRLVEAEEQNRNPDHVYPTLTM